MDNKYINRIVAQYKKATEVRNEYIKYAMDNENVNIWYIMIENLTGNNNELKSGQYIFKIELPKDFPYNPPDFFAKTPNGLYMEDKICCISIGTFHKDNYRASLGVSGFAMELANGLMNWEVLGTGVNIIKTTKEDKRRYAEQSAAYNKKYNERILKMIEDQYEEYSKKWG